LTTVINIRKAPYGWQQKPEYVYIGRPSIFGNPFAVGKKCKLCGEVHSDGGSTLPCYKKYFDKRIAEDHDFKSKVLELKDKILICYCEPNPCHGRIIAAYLDKE
jgi:hypothetical protein